MPYSDLLSLWLRIYFLNLATFSKSPAHSSTGTRSAFKCLPLVVSIGFHVLFHSPTGVLFTFPSRYYFTIGHLGVFSLTRWSSLIHTGFHVPHATRDIQKKGEGFDYWTFTIFGAGFSCFVSSFIIFCIPLTPTTPLLEHNGLGCSHFARRYSGNRFCFLFLWLLRCFSSPGCLFLFYEFKKEFYRRLPYSGIFGSMLVTSSPKRIAGICALHRL